MKIKLQIIFVVLGFVPLHIVNRPTLKTHKVQNKFFTAHLIFITTKRLEQQNPICCAADLLKYPSPGLKA